MDICPSFRCCLSPVRYNLISVFHSFYSHLLQFRLQLFQIEGVNFLAGIQCSGMFLSIALNKDAIVDLHHTLQEIVDDGEFSNLIWAV